MEPGFEFIARLGEGSYGSVLLCRMRSSDSSPREKLVAVKRFKWAHTDELGLRVAMREVRLLRSLIHPLVIRLERAFSSASGRLYAVFPFIDGGCGQRVLKSFYPNGLPSAFLKSFAWQLCVAVGYLHSKRVLHRDIKPSNVLLSTDGTIRLCDFGFARQVAAFGNTAAAQDELGGKSLTPYVQTRPYRAPEVLLGQPYGAAADIWSIGATIAEMALGHPLLPGSSSLDQLWRILGAIPGPRPAAILSALDTLRRIDPAKLGQTIPPELLRPTQLPGPQLRERLARLDPLLVDLIEACLQLAPEQRPSTEGLLAMPWFADVAQILQYNPVLMQLYDKVTASGPAATTEATAATSAAAAAAAAAAASSAARSAVMQEAEREAARAATEEAAGASVVPVAVQERLQIELQQQQQQQERVIAPPEKLEMQPALPAAVQQPSNRVAALDRAARAAAARPTAAAAALGRIKPGAVMLAAPALAAARTEVSVLGKPQSQVGLSEPAAIAEPVASQLTAAPQPPVAPLPISDAPVMELSPVEPWGSFDSRTRARAGNPAVSSTAGPEDAALSSGPPAGPEPVWSLRAGTIRNFCSPPRRHSMPGSTARRRSGGGGGGPRRAGGADGAAQRALPRRTVDDIVVGRNTATISVRWEVGGRGCQRGPSLYGGGMGTGMLRVTMPPSMGHRSPNGAVVRSMSASELGWAAPPPRATKDPYSGPTAKLITAAQLSSSLSEGPGLWRAAAPATVPSQVVAAATARGRPILHACDDHGVDGGAVLRTTALADQLGPLPAAKMNATVATAAAAAAAAFADHLGGRRGGAFCDGAFTGAPTVNSSKPDNMDTAAAGGSSNHCEQELVGATAAWDIVNAKVAVAAAAATAAAKSTRASRRAAGFIGSDMESDPESNLVMVDDDEAEEYGEEECRDESAMLSGGGLPPGLPRSFLRGGGGGTAARVPPRGRATMLGYICSAAGGPAQVMCTFNELAYASSGFGANATARTATDTTIATSGMSARSRIGSLPHKAGQRSFFTATGGRRHHSEAAALHLQQPSRRRPPTVESDTDSDDSTRVSYQYDFEAAEDELSQLRGSPGAEPVAWFGSRRAGGGVLSPGPMFEVQERQPPLPQLQRPPTTEVEGEAEGKVTRSRQKVETFSGSCLAPWPPAADAAGVAAAAVTEMTQSADSGMGRSNASVYDSKNGRGKRPEDDDDDDDAEWVTGFEARAQATRPPQPSQQHPHVQLLKAGTWYGGTGDTLYGTAMPPCGTSYRSSLQDAEDCRLEVGWAATDSGGKSATTVLARAAAAAVQPWNIPAAGYGPFAAAYDPFVPPAKTSKGQSTSAALDHADTPPMRAGGCPGFGCGLGALLGRRLRSALLPGRGVRR